jgi:3-dehydroquinate dehydratase II
MIPILVLHGPNLNLLGTREPGVYGQVTIEEIDQRMAELSGELGLETRPFQSNHEGKLIDRLHEAREWERGVIFNPAGYTHTSVALRDAVSAINLPVVEVHLSNTQAREEFRHRSLIAPVCVGSVAGFGWRSYLVALYAMKGIFDEVVDISGTTD